jgi:tRNA nucleotidyltransferase (CCA-adding enzyme)
MNRLKFDNDTKYRVCKLVLHHDERPALNEKSVRRSMAKLGADCFPDMYYLKEADIKGQSAYKREEKLKNLENYRRLCEEVFEKQQALSVKDLKITGKDLLEIGIPQGKELGATLKRLLDAVIEDPEKNERETLLGMARQKV